MRTAIQRGISLFAVLGMLLFAAMHGACAQESEAKEKGEAVKAEGEKGATEKSEGEKAEAQEAEGSVLEIGATNDWTVRNGSGANAGASIGYEVTVIENWLNVEVGAEVLGTSGVTEVAGDLILKVPFRVSETVEFLVGAGPKEKKVLNGPDQGTYSGAEVNCELMFWPRKTLGWYVEPAWSLVSRTGEQSVGITVGVLLRLPGF
ncbi:MAG TPA: hypothetical protein VEI05_02405 [Burkholderiaceae bacterium]|nr:hypothetical protein [Burkholderiaceae bacterium]